MLDADVLHDPANEILALQAKLETSSSAEQSAARELADLRQAPADVVPLVGRDAIGSDAECTQRRIQILVQAAEQGAGLPKKVSDNPIDLAHTRDELQAVALGKRQLSRWERSWCLAEAMVMTTEHYALEHHWRRIGNPSFAGPTATDGIAAYSITFQYAQRPTMQSRRRPPRSSAINTSTPASQNVAPTHGLPTRGGDRREYMGEGERCENAGDARRRRIAPCNRPCLFGLMRWVMTLADGRCPYARRRQPPEPAIGRRQSIQGAERPQPSPIIRCAARRSAQRNA